MRWLLPLVILWGQLAIGQARVPLPELVIASEALYERTAGILARMVVLHDPADLQTWDGRSGLSPEVVYDLADELREELAAVGPQLITLEQSIRPATVRDRESLLDDLRIARHALETASNLLVLGADRHADHAQQPHSCQHENPALVDVMESLRDLCDTVGLVVSTLTSSDAE